MVHIKRFLESNNIRHHSRLSVEDIEDLFLELIDSGDIRLHSSEISLSQGHIAVYFILDKKFNVITDPSSMSRLTKVLKGISDICNHWKLDWKFELCNDEAQLEISQPVPQIILNQFQNPHSHSPIFNIQFIDGHKYRFSMRLDVFKDNMDLYMIFGIDTWLSGSGMNGRWIKSDWVYFAQNESDIIKKLEEEYNKVLPCQYLDKVEVSRELHFGIKKYNYRFKLLV